MPHALWKGGFGLLLGLSATLGFALSGGGAGSEPPPPPVNTEFAGVLLRLGLSAESLAAAGVTGPQVSSLVNAARDQYSAETLLGLDASYADTRTTRDRLSRLVRSGTGSPADVSALAQAEAALTSATNDRATHLNAMRSAALATVTGPGATTLETIQANQSWRLPTQYLVKNRTQADWVMLRDALATKRICQKEGVAVPDSTQTYLAAVDAEAEIAAARVSLDTNIAAVQTAWNLAADH